jgi:hypothetical protein
VFHPLRLALDVDAVAHAVPQERRPAEQMPQFIAVDVRADLDGIFARE